MEEIQVKIEPEDLENEVIADDSEFEIKMDIDEIKVKLEPDGFPNLLEHLENITVDGLAESSSEFKRFKSPKKEVEEMPEYFEILSDSESNCEEIEEEVEEKYTPPVVLLSTSKKNSAEVLECSERRLEFSKHTHLRKHMKAVHGSAFAKANKCSLIQKQFEDKAQSDFHKLYVHTNNEELNRKMPVAPVGMKNQCSKCDLKFPTNTDLQIHMRTVHKNNANKYKCLSCQKEFYIKARLYTHKCVQNSQKEKTEELNSCPKCGLTFTTAFRLQNHEYFAHPVKKEFQCSICDLNFSSENIKMLHEKFTHPTRSETEKNIKTESISQPIPNPITSSKIKHEGDFRCPFCPSSWKSQLSLHRHSQVHIFEDNKAPLNLNCTKCSQTFENITGIVSHEKHHGDNFPCTLCPGIFVSKYYLLTHRRDAHPECQIESTEDARYKCQRCHKLFVTPEETKEHEKSHAKYSCDLCPDVFDTLNIMKRHRQFLHPESMQFECSKCPLNFSTRKDRKKHLNTHKETISFTIKCYKCNITFTTLLEKARHEEKFHSKSKPDISIKSKSKLRKESLSVKKTLKRKAYLEDPRVVSCDLCSKLFLSKYNLNEHKVRKYPEFQEAPKKQRKSANF